MATAQTDLSDRELRSRLSLLVADPEERSGPTSICNSPPSYASSEATEIVDDPRPDRVPLNVVQKQHEDWMASADLMIRSTDASKSVTEYIRKRKE